MRKIKRKKTNCTFCNKIFNIRPRILEVGKGKFCSKRCHDKSLIGKHNLTKGGRTKDFGYYLIFSPEHPYKNNKGYVREHCLVMEKHLGRTLLPTEVVHHINNNPSDNRIENLMLFPNKSEHTKHHHPKGEKFCKKEAKI